MQVVIILQNLLITQCTNIPLFAINKTMAVKCQQLSYLACVDQRAGGWKVLHINHLGYYCLIFNLCTTDYQYMLSDYNYSTVCALCIVYGSEYYLIMYINFTLAPSGGAADFVLSLSQGHERNSRRRMYS